MPIAALVAVEVEADGEAEEVEEGVEADVGRGATVAMVVGAGVMLDMVDEEDEDCVVERGDDVSEAVGDAVEGAEARVTLV